jgi:hypothetical protein
MSSAADVAEHGLERFEKIEWNPLYRILFESSASRETKTEAIARELGFAVEAPRRDDEARGTEYAQLIAYLRYEREQMALEVARITGSRSFEEVEPLACALDSARLALEERLAPLAETIDAVDELRAVGRTLDVLREIHADAQAAAERAQRIVDKRGEISRLGDRVRGLERRIALQAERKRLLRFLGGDELTRKARRQIALLRASIEETGLLTESLEADLAALERETPRPTRLDEHAAHKAALRALLASTSDEHAARAAALETITHDFVVSTHERMAPVLARVEELCRHADALHESELRLRHAREIVVDAGHKARSANASLREHLQQPIADAADLEEASNLEAIETLRDAICEQIQRVCALRDASMSSASERLSALLGKVTASHLELASDATRSDTVQDRVGELREKLGVLEKSLQDAARELRESIGRDT